MSDEQTNMEIEPPKRQLPEYKVGMTREEMIAFLNSSISLLHEVKDISDMAALRECFELLCCINSSDITVDVTTCNEIIKKLQMPEIMFALFKKLQALRPIEDASENKELWKTYKLIFSVIWNVADCSTYFATKMSSLGMSAEWSSIICCEEYFSQLGESSRIYNVVKSTLHTMHNVVRISGNSHFFSRPEIKAALVKFIPMKDDPDLSMAAMFCLAYIINEDDRHLLKEGTHVIDDLLEYIREAMEDTENRRSDGFSISELLSAMSALTVNDSISKAVVEGGGYSVLKSLCDAVHPEELEFATKIIWHLLFTEENREHLGKENVAKFLTDLKQSLLTLEDPILNSVRKNIEGSLWLLQGESVKSAQNEDNENIKQKLEVSKKAKAPPPVFISYCWSNKAEVMKVYSELKSLGVNCWLDTEQMQGSTLEAMATGIEDASVVLICYSEAYRKSPNCRLEAEYAMSKQKSIIPLCMQYKYKPDGWLGIILGTKLYYDFSGKKDFEGSFSAFHVALVRFLPLDTDDTNQVDVIIQSSPQRSTKRVDSIKAQDIEDSTKVDAFKWSFDDFSNWLVKEGLGHLVPNFNAMNGRLLIRYLRIKQHAPEFFYSTLIDKFQLGVLDALTFLVAVENGLKLPKE